MSVNTNGHLLTGLDVKLKHAYGIEEWPQNKISQGINQR